MNHGSRIKIFAGNSNETMAKEICTLLNMPLGVASITKFMDGEVSVNIMESVRGTDVFIIQSLCSPVNDHIMELLIMIDAMKRASAATITAVIPYYGYARQDRKVHPRDPIAAKLLADILTAAGATRILTMDLHARQIQGFFDMPVDHLHGVPVLAQHYIERHFKGDDLVVVSPDLGGVTRARNFAGRLDAPIAIVDKRRPKANMTEVMNIVGDIIGKRCIIIDDLCDTGGTFLTAAKALLERGAKEIYACATHAILSNGAEQRFMESDIKELVLCDTIPLPDERNVSKIRILSIAPVFAKAIERIFEDQPISMLTE